MSVLNIIPENNYTIPAANKVSTGDSKFTNSVEISLRLSKLGLPNDTLSVSYVSNSQREKHLILYVRNFCRQFSYLYQDRKIPFLTAENAAGIEKVVCTTIRPTALSQEELDNWAGCAQFVADYLNFEQLEYPTNVPSRLLDPWTIHKRKKANCFEYSTLLCSMLLGIGYDAYIVNGYATEAICTDVTEREESPKIVEEEEIVNVVEEKKIGKYVVKGVKAELESDFEALLLQRANSAKRLEAAEEQKREKELERELTKPPHDHLYGQRVHSWVMVKGGKREVPEDFFIEPVLGWKIPLNTDKYLGIESIWNNENYWVNMQLCKEGVKDLFYDFTDSGMWECFLPYVPLTLATPSDTIEEMEMMPQPPLSQEKFDMPASWAQAFVITSKNLQSRFPSEKKTKLFKYTKVEGFNEYETKDGIVKRVCHYKTWDRKELQTVEEDFKHRADKLYKRIHDHVTGSVTDYYKHGQSQSLKEHTYRATDPGIQGDRKLLFYFENRADGLVQRQVTQEEMIDVYVGRMDFLKYRHTWFGVRIKKFGPASTTQRTILKIHEKFDKNEDKSANDDYAEVIYNLTEGKIMIIYHRDVTKISASWREFVKPMESARRDYHKEFSLDAMKEFQADPEAKPLSRLEAYMILHEFSQRETRALNRIRDDEAELQNLLTERAQEESACNIEVSPYNSARNQAVRKARLAKLQQEIEDRQSQEKDQDYLLPYFIQFDCCPPYLSLRQAQLVIDSCLSDYKAQLLEQFNIIQRHHERELKVLKREQENFRENGANFSADEIKAYNKKCEQLQSTLKVIEFRLLRHREEAAQKYLLLDKKLKNDSRVIIGW
uniref:Coiled-coil domain-containing protein 135 n=1 Tax=Strigamia maritima TaxID=126957 RepID=T1IPY2_STRMM